jgi:beta-ribofuranosylaminobenzene 5'-phosphate synthase
MARSWSGRDSWGGTRKVNAGAITIITGSRLHFGPLAWKPRRGRDFGGWGVMLETPRTVVRVGKNESIAERQSHSQSRAEEILNRVLKSLDIDEPTAPRVVVDEEPPPHCGFGSGTQLALAIAAGVHIAKDGIRPPASQLARMTGRGLRSAVGIHGFDLGGLLVDAGKRSSDEIGQLAARVDVPDEWRFVLVRTPVAEGLAGDEEATAFNDLPSFSDTLSDRLSRIVLTEVLPSVQSKDCAAFTAALDEYGTLVGEAFTPCQGGVVHRASKDIWRALRERGLKGIAQTSWGPTLAVVCEDVAHAEKTMSTIRELAPSVAFDVARPRNEGASIIRD